MAWRRAGVGEEFGDRVIAAAILDRLLRYAVTMNIRGNSYRLNDQLKAGLVRSHDDNPFQPGGAILTTMAGEDSVTLDTGSTPCW